MHGKFWWLGVVAATIAVCQLGTWGMQLLAGCEGAVGRTHCHDHMLLTDLALMLLPVALLLVRGLAIGLRQLYHTRRVVHTIRSYPPALPTHALHQQVQNLGIAERVDVVAWDRAEAFCYGFLRPRICMTTGLLAALHPAEVEAVLRHERHHLRRRDPLRVLGWTVLRGACPWLAPQAAHADMRRELAADRAVMREQGRAPLASALLKLVTRPRDAHLHGIAVSGVSVTDARIDQLLAPDQPAESKHAPRPGRWLAGPLALLAYVVGCSIVMTMLP